MAEIKYNLEKERVQKDAIAQTDWAKSIINNPRYAMIPDLRNDNKGYNKQGSFGYLRKSGNQNYEVVVVIYQGNKHRPSKFNMHEAILYLALVNDLVIAKDSHENRDFYYLYKEKYWSNLWGEIGDEIQFIDLCGRMKRYQRPSEKKGKKPHPMKKRQHYVKGL